MNFLSRLLVECIDYYDFVLDCAGRFQVFEFINFNNNFYGVIDSINHKFEQGLKPSELHQRIDCASENFSGATGPLGTSKPTSLKEEKKEPLKQSLEDLPDMVRARGLYRRLVALSY